jgi:hypothetical protein
MIRKPYKKMKWKPKRGEQEKEKDGGDD